MGMKSGIVDQDMGEKSYQRIIDTQPIMQTLQIMQKAGRKNFHADSEWETCLCALILKLEPGCKIQRILEALPYEPKPLEDVDFLNTMANLGYRCYPAECDLHDIDDRLLPGVFIPNNGTPYLVLSRDDDGELRFFDPISKSITNVPSSFAEEGKVWFFQSYNEEKSPISKFMRKGSGDSWFRALLSRFKGTFAQIVFAGFVLNIIALTTPFFIMMVYDKVINTNSLEVLIMLTLGACGAIFFEYKLRNIRSVGLSWLSGRLDNIVSNKIFSHLIGLSPETIESASVSSQIARIKTFESIRDFFSGSMFLSLLELPFVFIALLCIALIAKSLVFVPLAMICGYLALFFMLKKQVKISMRLAAKASSARQQFTIDTFEKLEDIRRNGLDSKWQKKFRNLSGQELMLHFRLNWLGAISETFAHALTIISSVATVGFGTLLIWNGTITPGALVASMILVWRVLTPFYSLCTMISRFEQLQNSIGQVNKLMDIETEAEESRSYSKLSAIRGAISFNNVSFRYNDNSDMVLSDLSFDIQPGALVTLTGRNGSGKGTVLKLIKRMYLPNSGMVSIDGFDIRQLDAKHLRCQIAYIPKIPHLFSGSIFENLKLSNPLASPEEMKEALILADVWDEILQMPESIHTVIGYGGQNGVSSGLCTKISLARAYINPASILLIDELPNTLFSEKAGKNLLEYIEAMKGKKTIMICSYREDIKEKSDQILNLAKSKEAKTHNYKTTEVAAI